LLGGFEFIEETEVFVFDQQLADDTPQPNENERRQTGSNDTLIVRFYRLFRGGRTAHYGLVA
jgi:hypothetical protein